MAEKLPKVYSISSANPPGVKQKLLFFALNDAIPRALRLLCRVAPVVNVPGTNVTLVTGFDLAQEVFARPKDFEVPFEKHMEVLEWDNFLLAMQDTPAYHHVHANVMRLWQPDDADRIATIVRSTAADILAESSGRIEFIQDVVKPVLLAVVEQHYGVDIPEAQRQPFLDGNLAASGFVFTGPKIGEKSAESARAAVAEVWPVIDAAMAATKDSVANDASPGGARASDTGAPADTVLQRYYRAEIDVPQDPAVPDGPTTTIPLTEHFDEDLMRSSLLAMIGGYLPTVTNASGRVMEVLTENHEAMSFVENAVASGDDDALLRGLLEALRLNYIIPVLWRRSKGEQQVGVEGSEHTIDAGRTVAVSLQSAMFDSRRVVRPKEFNADRSADDSMVYGHRFHYCVGELIANTILTELFRLLVAANVDRPNDAKVRKIRWVGMYPWTLWIDHDPSGASEGGR